MNKEKKRRKIRNWNRNSFSWKKNICELNCYSCPVKYSSGIYKPDRDFCKEEMSQRKPISNLWKNSRVLLGLVKLEPWVFIRIATRKESGIRPGLKWISYTYIEPRTNITQACSALHLWGRLRRQKLTIIHYLGGRFIAAIRM